VAGGGPNHLPATEANVPAHSLAVDDKGDLYIAAWITSRVFKVDKRGLLTVVAGTGALGFSGDGGPATEASLSYPTGVALDAEGNLYIADQFRNRSAV